VGDDEMRTVARPSVGDRTADARSARKRPRRNVSAKTLPAKIDVCRELSLGPGVV
jgi:hypothetical protein